LSEPLLASARCGLSIYAARESLSALSKTLTAASQACTGIEAVVDVVVNGNPPLATSLAQALSEGQVATEPVVRVWSLSLGDKAGAWNHYIHAIAPAASHYVFLDGYAELNRDAVGELMTAVERQPTLLAATGVPSMGAGARRTAAQMRADGGLHGNCHLLTARALTQLRAIGFRLPLGLYRGDGTLGAALAFGLDLQPRKWDVKARIVVCDRAAWRIEPLRWWRGADWQRHWRRMLRQAQGDLENRAVRYFFSTQRLPLGALPRTAHELVEAWMTAEPEAAHSALRGNWMRRRALAELRQPRNWQAAGREPLLVWSNTAKRQDAATARSAARTEH
jgi:hypothetical protein